MPAEILFISILRALVEVAGMLMLGQGLLWLFGPKARDGNFIYDLFKKGTSPFIKATRFIMPKFIHDAHIGLVAFLILLWIWFGLGVAKRHICVAQQLVCT